MREMAITEARQVLTSLPDTLLTEDGAVAVTRNGKPVLAVMPWDFYEALVETLEILGEPELMKSLRRSLAQADRGELIPWAQVKAELDH